MWRELKIGIAIAIVIGLVSLIAVANAGPYVDLDCPENGGYTITQTPGQPTLKNPGALCDEKQESIHPFLFDAKVAIEYSLGLGDYTWEPDEIDDIPPPKVYLFQLGNTSTPNETLSCREAGQWIADHPDARVGVKITNYPLRYRSSDHPASGKITNCYAAIRNNGASDRQSADA